MWRKSLVALVLSLSALTAGSAPDEDELGKAAGYPQGKGEKWDVWQTPYRVGSFSAMDEIYAHCTIAPSTTPLPLKRAARTPDFRYQFYDKKLSIDDYLNRERVTGLLILKDGEILVERYQYGRTANHRFLSNSIAKTITSMALGIALHEKKIASLDDKAAKYEPRLAGTLYGETPLRDLLRMSSGVKFVEVYDGQDDMALWDSTEQAKGTLAAAKLFKERERESGKAFKYASSETGILALALRGATGGTLCDWVSQKIWQPMGAESKATWITAADGVEKAYAYFNATLRDFARFGWLLANDGKLGDKQIIPREYVLDATRAERQPPNFRPGEMYNQGSNYYGYGYQTWILPGSQPRFVLLGVYGQTIFVDPGLKLVMVNTSVGRGGFGDFDEVSMLWQGVVEHYGRW